MDSSRDLRYQIFVQYYCAFSIAANSSALGNIFCISTLIELFFKKIAHIIIDIRYFFVEVFGSRCGRFKNQNNVIEIN